MSSLYNFPCNPNETSTFAKNERIVSLLPANELSASPISTRHYPEININRELFHASRSQADKNVLIQVEESMLKVIFRTYFEEGLVAALRVAGKSENFIGKGAQYFVRVLDAGRQIKVFFRPHLKIQGVECIAKFSQTRNWMTSPIRCISWHPNYFKLAVAAEDDSVRLYSDKQGIVPLLKHGLQKGICCMSWRPWSASEIAIGTQNGVLLWTIENFLQNSSIKSQSQLLRHESHTPVTSIQWDPNGTLLATASTSCPDVLIWDVDRNKRQPLKRVGAPAALLSWAPNGGTFCATTISNIFRIWKTNNWTMDRWEIGSGNIQSLAWSPCSSFLLFVTTDEPFLYSLGFVDDYVFANSASTKQAMPIADLSKTEIEGMEIGGRPQSLAMSPQGNLLAISFKDTNSIAVFSVSTRKFLLNVTPLGLISGLGIEFPSVICFEDTKEKNCLTIGWSSGRIQYFPFI
uniref:CSON008714 protein n=1 Tax=Culicoides sonorensis TaxID=179676 RepID=A0A336KDM3_CULSO